MRRKFENFINYFTTMESSSQKAVWIAFVLFTIAGIIAAAGTVFLEVDQGAIANFFRGLRGLWWSPIAVTLVFVVLAFLGAPQVILIAATVAVFDTYEGIVLSWVATLVSASVGFGLGRFGGAGLVQKLMGGRGKKALRFISNNGFLTSLLVRQVPTGPFILVNLALGAAKIRASWFIAGTGLGILPKILLVAFGSEGIEDAFDGDGLGALVFFIAAAIIWALIVFGVRPMLLKLQNRD